MKCPACDLTLVISSREGIEIDHCPQCRGVWLDRGELDKIIDRAAPSVVGAERGGDRDDRYDDRPRDDDRPRYDDRPRDDDRPRYDERQRYDERPRYDRDHDDRHRGDVRYPPRRKKKGSFLEDLFDFG